MLRQFTCILLLGYLPLGHCADPDTYLLKYGHMRCRTEADVASLAAAESDTELRSQLVGKIYTGACTAASMPMEKIVSVVKKTTSNGGIYYCFNVVDLDVVNEKTECAPSFLVTTLRQELAQRNGDFEVQARGPYSVRAKCKEGGIVFLFNKDGNKDGIWWRNAQVIPVDTPEVRLVGIGIDQAIRDGCRGDDAR